jgi:voltage-gated potassium channel
MATKGIALFGYYRSGAAVAAYLRAGDYRLVIIDDHPENLEKASNAGYETAELDFRDDSELAKLGLGDTIDSVFCLFPDDAENVFLTLSVRALAPEIRIYSIAHGSSAVPNLHAAGADKVIETEEISGMRIWDIITRPIVTAILDRTLFGQANLNVMELQIPKGSRFVGRRISDLDLENHYNLVLLGMVDHDLKEHFVHSQTIQDVQLQEDDILVVIGPMDASTILRQDLQAVASQPGNPPQ